MSKVALQKSIIKWWSNLKVAYALPESSIYGLKLSVEDCPLCRLYFEDDCRGCPVFEDTGTSACYGTPYEQVTSAVRDYKLQGDNIHADKVIIAVKAEVDYLKGLLNNREII